jgi:hypothetical protein
VNRLRLNLVLIITITLAVSALSLLLPQPPGADAREFYNPLATSITLIDVGVCVGAAILFYRARRNFKPELKPAYSLLAAGTLMLGVLNIDYPITEYYNLWYLLFFNLASYFPYLCESILIYLGARQFYKIATGKKHWLMNIPLMLGIAAVAWVIDTQTNHLVGSWPSETSHDNVQAIVLIPVVAYIASLYLVLKVWRRLGKEYKRAFGWLALSLAVYCFTSLMIAVMEIVGYDNWFFNSRAYEIPVILADVLVLVAGYQFNQIGLVTERRYGFIQRLLGRQSRPVTSVDIIVYVAGLAADPAKINDALDKMRAITARMPAGHPLELSQSDQRTLKEVYVSIENYLATSDPLREYQKDKLRAAVSKRFALDQNRSTTFWGQLAS